MLMWEAGDYGESRPKLNLFSWDRPRGHSTLNPFKSPTHKDPTNSAMLIINEGKLHRTNNIIWKSNSTHQIGWNTPWPHPPTFPDWLRRRKSFSFCWPSILTSGLRASGRSSFHRGSEKELKELDPRLLGSKTWWNRSLCSAERKELVEDGQHVTGGRVCTYGKLLFSAG